jgi:micrococcal nuclease
MPLRLRHWTDILNRTSLGLDEGDAGAPFGGGGFTIPRKWLIAGAVVIASCFLILLGVLAFKAVFPGPTRAEQEATVTAAFATVVQENLATFRAQPRPVIPSSTAVLAPTETATATATPTLLPSATAAPFATETPPTATTAADFSTPTDVAGAACIPGNPAQTAGVIEVVDGDTIKVVLEADRQTYSVRYIGMDTPEMNPPGLFMATEAKTRNAQLTAGKTLTLVKDVSEVDRYGRLLRYVVADGVFVNYALVAEGYARAASYPPDIACIPTFQAVEQQALAARLGLWATSPTLIPLPTSGRSVGVGPCDCTGPDLDCADLITHAEAQACYDTCLAQGYGDVFNLDGDGDGQACEGLP